MCDVCTIAHAGMGISYGCKGNILFPKNQLRIVDEDFFAEMDTTGNKCVHFCNYRLVAVYISCRMVFICIFVSRMKVLDISPIYIYIGFIPRYVKFGDVIDSSHFRSQIKCVTFKLMI